jgi:hypothetical protein
VERPDGRRDLRTAVQGQQGRAGAAVADPEGHLARSDAGQTELVRRLFRCASSHSRAAGGRWSSVSGEGRRRMRRTTAATSLLGDGAVGHQPAIGVTHSLVVHER